MRLAVIIPARYASTRLPGKALIPLLGKPLIQHVWERARSGPDIALLAVATDDGRIARVVEGFGGRVVMTSPEHPSGTDRLAEAARLLGLSEGDIVVNVQGDMPLFDPEDLGRLARALDDPTPCEAATLAARITRKADLRDANCVKVVFGNDGLALYFSRLPVPMSRDAGPVERWKHLGIYAYRCGFLERFRSLPVGRLEEAEKLEQLRILENGFRIRVVQTEHDVPDVNAPEDIPRVERFLGSNAGAL